MTKENMMQDTETSRISFGLVSYNLLFKKKNISHCLFYNFLKQTRISTKGASARSTFNVTFLFLNLTYHQMDRERLVPNLRSSEIKSKLENFRCFF